jgi:magnesium chelatase subunit I
VAAGYRARSVREELRENLLAKLRSGAPIFTGVVGYETPWCPRSRTRSCADTT